MNTIKRLYPIIDPNMPIWINKDGKSELFDTVDDIPKEYHDIEITYITIDANWTLTIEL